MKMSQRIALTRRAVLSATATILAPPAWAIGAGADGLSFPLRIGYARIGPAGFTRLDAADRTRWSEMQLRLGALADLLVPLQPTTMFSPSPPTVDGGASCALAARQMAADLGLGHALLYAVDDGAATQGWIAQCFAAVRAAGGGGQVTGEAHLLDITGGAPVQSVFADAPRRGVLGALAGRPKGSTTTLDALASDMERAIQHHASRAFAGEYSIADGFMRSPR